MSKTIMLIHGAWDRPRKVAWKHVQSAEFESASVPGAATTTVQLMVNDSKK